MRYKNFYLRNMLIVSLLTVMLFTMIGCENQMECANNSTQSENHLPKSDDIITEINLMKDYAELYSEELKVFMEENFQLLDTLQGSMFALPYEMVVIYNMDGKYEANSLTDDLPEVVVELQDLFDKMQESGLEWQIMRVWPEEHVISIEVLHRDGNKARLSVSIHSPPLEEPDLYYDMGFLEVSENWGIFWSVHATNGA